MASDKKFFVHLYPKDGDMNRKWFIKYSVPNYTTGKLDEKKYKGYLNLIPDKEQRIAEAQRLLQCIERGEPLPDVKGARFVPPPEAPRNFADTIQLAYKVVDTFKYRMDGASDYQSRIKILNEWMSKNGMVNFPVGRFTVQHAKDFLRWLKENGRTNTTHNNYRSCLGCIWKEFKSEGIVTVNPWYETKALPRMSVPFRAMSASVEQTIIDNLPVFDAQLWIVAQFVYYDFIRVAECRRLKLYMVDWHMQTITLPAHVSRKGKRERTVVIPDTLFQQLIDLQYHQMNPEHFIFSKSGVPGAKQLAFNNLSNRFRAFREHFNIPLVYKLYGMKHTGNSKLARMGVNAQLQRLHNGHTSLEYTQRYLSGLSISDTNFLKKDFPKFGDNETPL